MNPLTLETDCDRDVEKINVDSLGSPANSNGPVLFYQPKALSVQQSGQ